jgi:iron complex transport system substrate-binding protein
VTIRLFLRVCAPVLLAIALTACGDEAADPGPPPADDEPADSEEAGADASDGGTGDTNLAGCVDQPDEDADYFPDRLGFDHAESVDISYHETYKVLEVDLAFADEPVRYVLVQCGLDAPDLDGDLADAAVIEVPVETAVTMTTTNLPHFDELDAVDRLVGVGNPSYVTTESVRDAIEAGDVEAFGDADGAPEIERVAAAQPDVLVTDAFGETVLDTAARIDEAGVPVLLNTDFQETSLLARAEWFKVTAALLNAERAAEERFAEIEQAYQDIRDRVADAAERPRVLSDVPFEGTWYAPGGQSVTAKAVEDAGGEYVFGDDDSPSSVAFDLETVLDRAADADVWIAAGSVHGTLDDLVAADGRFEQIAAVRDGQVWAGDAATSPEGGNARFEQAYLRADLFLADLAAIFHPGLVDHDPVFYGRVPEG